jgi:hypothetical protein
MRTRRLIHKKRINKITEAEFSYEDVSIWQDGALVLLTKVENVELAQIIVNEEQDLNYLEKTGEKKKWLN